MERRLPISAGFAISKPMIGSVIPGPLKIIDQVRTANYPDGSRHRLIQEEKRQVDPTLEFPDMNQQHASGHSFLEKLKQLMAGGGKQHPLAAMGEISGGHPKMMPGYQPIRENLQWRRQ